tara:strand:+ start:562 stop:753 length:192 start_codon:yes stop_codon:yes gene_type:complete
MVRPSPGTLNKRSRRSSNGETYYFTSAKPEIGSKGARAPFLQHHTLNMPHLALVETTHEGIGL